MITIEESDLKQILSQEFRVDSNKLDAVCQKIVTLASLSKVLQIRRVMLILSLIPVISCINYVKYLFEKWFYRPYL